MGLGFQPAEIAIFLGCVAATVLWLPWLVVSVRRRGAFGWGSAILAFASLIYAFGLIAYTLLPPPVSLQEACVDVVQLRPLRFVSDILAYGIGGVGEVLRNRAVWQILLNIVLFLPLGAFVRHATRWPVWAVALIAAGVSAFIEVTQLTGLYGLASCPYRVFDVDDLLVNTLGGALGTLGAPLLARLPGQPNPERRGDPRPMSGWRRVGVGVVDAGLAHTMSVPLAILLMATGPEPTGVGAVSAVAAALSGVLAGLVLGAVILRSGRSAGEMVFHLASVRPDGRAPTAGQRLLRAMTSVPGFCLATAVPLIGPVLVVAWPVVAVILAFTTRENAGLSLRLAGLRPVDARSDRRVAVMSR